MLENKTSLLTEDAFARASFTFSACFLAVSPTSDPSYIGGGIYKTASELLKSSEAPEAMSPWLAMNFG